MVYIRKPVVRSENIIDRRAGQAGISARGRKIIGEELVRLRRVQELARLRRTQELMKKALEDAIRRPRF